MYSEYDSWNEIKKKIALSTHKSPYFKESDIWLISIGYNIGSEEYGKGSDYARPVLVVRKFNKELFLALPLSTKIKENRYYFPLYTRRGNVSLLLSQVRVFSSKRLIYKMDEIGEETFKSVIERLIRILKLPPSIARGSRG